MRKKKQSHKFFGGKRLEKELENFCSSTVLWRGAQCVFLGVQFFLLSYFPFFYALLRGGECTNDFISYNGVCNSVMVLLERGRGFGE